LDNAIRKDVLPGSIGIRITGIARATKKLLEFYALAKEWQ
jgi:hypothetical protein